VRPHFSHLVGLLRSSSIESILAKQYGHSTSGMITSLSAIEKLANRISRAAPRTRNVDERSRQHKQCRAMAIGQLARACGRCDVDQSWRAIRRRKDAGSVRKTVQNARNSATSTRRSPDSHFETND
jgi:hypothetical protein